MVTTFLRSECKDILQPALNAILLAIGMNQHFPQDMAYGHFDQFGLAIPHLYDSQGFLHLSALLKFGSSDCTMGQLIRQSYETLQIELGLPGEILINKHSDWSIVCTPTWLTHTWQYTSEYRWEITTGLPSLPLKCNCDKYLMEIFWNHGYRGHQLTTLNHC